MSKRSTAALLALVSLCAGQVTDPVTSDVNINCGACKVRGERTVLLCFCFRFFPSRPAKLRNAHAHSRALHPTHAPRTAPATRDDAHKHCHPTLQGLFDELDYLISKVPSYAKIDVVRMSASVCEQSGWLLYASLFGRTDQLWPASTDS